MYCEKDIVIDLVISTSNNCETPFLFGYSVPYNIGKVMTNIYNNEELLLLTKNCNDCINYLLKNIKLHFKYHPYIEQKIVYLQSNLHYHGDYFDEKILKLATEYNSKNKNLDIYFCLHC